MPRTSVARLFALAAAICFGCNRPTVGPQLRCESVSFGEDHVPLPVAVRVTNTGDAEATIDGVEAKIHSTVFISGPNSAGQHPNGFEHEVYLFGRQGPGHAAAPLDEGASLVLEAGETTDIWAAVQWQQPEDSPPMLVVCSASFVFSHAGKAQAETKPQAFVVQNQSGTLEGMIAAGQGHARQATETSRALSSIKGQPSQGLTKLRDSFSGGKSAD